MNKSLAWHKVTIIEYKKKLNSKLLASHVR